MTLRRAVLGVLVLGGLALAIVLLVVRWRNGAVLFFVTVLGLPVLLLLLVYFYEWREARLERTAASGTTFRGAAAIPIDAGLPPTLSNQVFARAKGHRIRACFDGLPSGVVQLSGEGLEWRPDPVLRRWGVGRLWVPWSSVRTTRVSEQGFLRLILVDGSTVEVAIKSLERARAALLTLGIPRDD